MDDEGDVSDLLNVEIHRVDGGVELRQTSYIKKLVQEWFPDNNFNVTIRSFGIPDEFIQHASRDEMIKMASLNGDAIFDQIIKF